MGNTPQGRKKLTDDQMQKLNRGQPVNMGVGVKIKKNPKTGMLEGVPAEWVEGYDLPLSIDMNKTVITKHLAQEIRPDTDLPESIINLINSQPLHVGKPQNVKQIIKLRMDPNSPYGIAGLTPDMEKLLFKHEVTHDLVRENPFEMIAVINGIEKKDEIPDNALITDSDFERELEKIKFLPQNPNQLYRFTKQLGKGAMCTVYQAFSRKVESQVHAVRVMKVADHQILQKIKIEAAVMSKCANPNIVNYTCSYYYMNCLFMFIEFMDGGCLAEVVYSYFKKIPENIAAFIMQEVLKGLLVIHEQKQIHRDLKSDNILVDKQGRIKIADFGFAIQLTKQQQSRKSLVGTPAWMAPQLIKKEKYNELVDVWSVGIIAVELAEGQPPYLRIPGMKALFYISSREPHRLNKQKHSPQYCDFVERCLQKDVKQRWSIKQLLEHPFITGIKGGQQERLQFAEMVRNKKEGNINELMNQG